MQTQSFNYQTTFADSIIYIDRPDAPYDADLGDFLGQMTDELDGGWIEEFVSAGPKQYAYRRGDNGEMAVKIRGFTLNSTSSKQLNFKSLKRLVALFLRNGCRERIDVAMHQIRRLPDRTVVTRTVRKSYRVVFDKCRVLRSGHTLPFGY